jgi:HSP90 family molecular chaperone
MVAEKVTVFTRSYRPEEKGWLWTSDGQSGYEIEPAGELDRGTKVVLNLREPEFARASRIEQIIKHYSNFVQFPIELNGNTVNTVQALWTRNKSEITDTEYEDFYKYIRPRHRAAALSTAFQRRRAARHPRAALCTVEKLRAAHAHARGQRSESVLQEGADSAEGQGPVPRVAALSQRRRR